MPINRYDSPANDNYQNTFIPLPYEQLMATVASRQSMVDREQALLDKSYEDTKNIKYIPGTKDEQYVKDYIGKLNSLVDKYYTQDLSDPIVKRSLKSEMNRLTDRTKLQNIESSYGGWDTNQKFKAELKAKGLYDPMLDEDPANQDFSSDAGIYQYITPQYQNPRPSAETYFKDIRASYLGDDGEKIYHGVTPEKIKQVVTSKWNEFSNTSEGRNYVKKIAKENGLDYNNPNVVKQIATDYLLGVGNEFTYKEMSGYVPEHISRSRAAKEEASQYVPPTPLVDTEGTSVLSDNKKYTGKNVYKEVEDIDAKLGDAEKNLRYLQDIGADPNIITQTKLEMSDLESRRELLANTVRQAEEYWDERYATKRTELDKEASQLAKKFGVSKDEFINSYSEGIGGKIMSKINNIAIGDDVSNWRVRKDRLDKEYQKNVNKTIEEGGIKSTYDKRVLPRPISVDALNNVSYLNSDGDKSYMASTSLLSHIKRNPQGFNLYQQSATSDVNNKRKNKEIEDLQNSILGASRLEVNSYSTKRNNDGSFDVYLDTMHPDPDTKTDVKSRTVKVRINEESQIQAFANDIRTAGYPTEAAMIEEPKLAEKIRENEVNLREGDTMDVNPYPGWHSYKIQKVGDGFNVLESDGKTRVSSGDVTLPTFRSIDDAIHYMYQVRNFAKSEMNKRK